MVFLLLLILLLYPDRNAGLYYRYNELCIDQAKPIFWGNNDNAYLPLF